MRDLLRTQDEERTSGAGMFILGVACGAAVGAALGVLFAPKAGSEMRQQIADQTEQLRQRATAQADRLRQRASEIYSGASEAITDVMARGREAINIGRETFQKSRPHDGEARDVG